MKLGIGCWVSGIRYWVLDRMGGKERDQRSDAGWYWGIEN